MRAGATAVGLFALVVATGAHAQALSPRLPGQPGQPPAAGTRPASPAAGIVPRPAFNAPLDVYPALVNARVVSRLPFLSPAQLEGRAPADVRVRVRIVLDAQGAVTLAELERSSGLAGFDALVIETLSRFRGPAPGASAPQGETFGSLPLPKDAARLQTVTTRGLALDVRARAPAAPPAPAPKEP